MQERKLIALTFDDGPNTDITCQILDILQKHNVVASFFLIGNLITKKTIPVIQREVALGHDIQNHSWTHSFMNKLSEKKILQEIAKTSAKITEITGKEPQFFRPPFIEVNDLMYELIKMPFICGQGVEDWVPSVSAEERCARVLEQATDGSIVLLHDMPKNINTVAALEPIIEGLKARDFEFVTITELFKRKNEPIAANPGKLYSVV